MPWKSLGCYDYFGIIQDRTCSVAHGLRVSASGAPSLALERDYAGTGAMKAFGDSGAIRASPHMQEARYWAIFNF